MAPPPRTTVGCPRSQPRDLSRYERILASEGLQPIESLFHRGTPESGHLVGFVSLHGAKGDGSIFDRLAHEIHGSANFADTPEAQVWRDFDAAIHGLTGWRREAIELLFAYSESGRLEAARRSTRHTRKQARVILTRFLRHAGMELRQGVLRRREREASP